MPPPQLIESWGSLPKNTPSSVGQTLLLPVVRPEINGKSFFVAGDKAIELEDTLDSAQPHWMGQELSDNVNAGQELLLGKR